MRSARKTAIFSIAFLLVLSIAILRPAEDVYASNTNGITREEAVAWANSLIGKGYDYDGAYGNQCVDIIKMYVATLGQENTELIYGNAIDYASKNLPSGWKYVYSGYEPGDIAIWTPGAGGADSKYGHVGIIDSADDVGFNAIEQNYDGQSYVTKNWHYCNVLRCAIRPDFPSTEKGKPMTSGYDRVLPDGDYIIANAGSQDKDMFYYMDIEGSDYPAKNNTNVSIWSMDAQTKANEDIDYEVWTITYSDGFYTIKQKGTNMFLSVSPDNSIGRGANIEVCQQNSSTQKWAISRNTDTKNGYRIQAQCSGYSIDLADNKLERGTNIHQWSGNATNAQSWMLIPYKPEQYIAEGRYVMHTSYGSFLMKVDETSNNIQLEEDYNFITEKNSFDVIKQSNGYYKFINVASGKALAVKDGASSWNANVELAGEKATTAQEWALWRFFYEDSYGNSCYFYKLVSRCNGQVIYATDHGWAGTNVVTFTNSYISDYESAQWWSFITAEYTISYDCGYQYPEKVTNMPVNQIKYYMNTTTLSSEIPQLEGYKFVGWTDGKKTYQPKAKITQVMGDLSLTAVWELNPTPTPTNTPKPTKTSAIDAFVERLYSVALNRVPESSGVNYWSNAIKNKEKYVSECARYFLIEVPEFAERGLSDEDFVETIYKTFFDREPSSTEKKNWTDKMQNGTVTRNQIVETLIDELPDFLGAAPTPTPSPTPTMTPTPTPSIKKIVEISAKNFPDNNFRGYISGSLDSDKDGWLSDIEINRATYLDVTKKSISSLKGIEYFTIVKYLMCSGNTLTSLDVSKNTSLTCLNCSNNKLTSLDVSKNTNLYSLETHNNNLSSLDVSNCRVKEVVDDQYLVFKEFGSYNAYVDVDKGDFYFSYDANVKIIGANVPTSNGSIADFAERLYTVALNRKSDADGKKYWVDEIKNGNKTGGECAHFFLIDAPEFLNRGLSDDEFVETLYKTFFGRESEPAGKAYWVGELKKGTKTREDVIGGFIDSTEWCNICATYGVKSGAPNAKAEKASENAKNFATRLYTCCLGRDPEADGLNYWGLALTNLEKTGCEAAGFFFTGDEFEGLGTSNKEYVKRLYKTFMDRTPAADEVEYWVGQIKSAKMNRKAVLQFFGQCEEFTNICAKYGIDRGTI